MGEDKEIVIRIRKPRGAAAQGAFLEVARNPKDLLAAQRLVNVATSPKSVGSSEQIEIDIQVK